MYKSKQKMIIESKGERKKRVNELNRNIKLKKIT